jgi:hypothetical protein
MKTMSLPSHLVDPDVARAVDAAPNRVNELRSACRANQKAKFTWLARLGKAQCIVVQGAP